MMYHLQRRSLQQDNPGIRNVFQYLSCENIGQSTWSLYSVYFPAKYCLSYIIGKQIYDFVEASQRGTMSLDSRRELVAIIVCI